MELIHAETTGPLIDLFFDVHHSLGHGFLERVYSNAMVVAGKRIGFDIKQDVPIQVRFEGTVVGKYQADLLVNHSVIVELKVCRALLPEHEAQLLNYLKATHYEVGMLLNFGEKPRYKRMEFENARKGNLNRINR
jgi:GxxExxY protein